MDDDTLGKPKRKSKSETISWWKQYVEMPLLLILLLVLGTGIGLVFLFQPPQTPVIQRISEIMNPTATLVPPDPQLVNYTNISSLASATPIVLDTTITPQMYIVDAAAKSCAELPLDDGARFVFRLWLQRSKELYRMNADGSNLCYLTRDGYVDDQAAWSPDGRKIAFVSTRGGYGIHVMDADGSNEKKVFGEGTAFSFPEWSPDGNQIIFQATIEKKFDLYIVNLDGTGLRNLTNDPRLDSAPAWSPDGQWIAFTSDRTFNPFIPNRLPQYSNYEIYLMSADGLNVHRLTSNDVIDFNPSWSPDSMRIAYMSGWRQIYVMNKDGSNQKFLTDGREPVWSSDGQKIAFLKDGAIYTYDLADETIVQVSDVSSIEYMDYWSPE